MVKLCYNIVVMSDLPELRPNQIGISCKTYDGHIGALKFEDETLYFTINKDTVAMELYPKKPVIIIDKDAIKMILNKIAEIENIEPYAWINVEVKLPDTEGYYSVKFEDGNTDEKPFRRRIENNINGFMSENKITHWRKLSPSVENLESSRFPFEMNQDSKSVTAAAADSNELNDLKDNGSAVAEAMADEGNNAEADAGKAAIISEHSELSAQPDKDGIF